MEKTLEDFRNDVIKELKVEYMFSYCPLCYGGGIILNSHRCQEGWELWFCREVSYTEKVEQCVKWMKKYEHSRILSPL
jgi:hypothetical protein